MQPMLFLVLEIITIPTFVKMIFLPFFIISPSPEHLEIFHPSGILGPTAAARRLISLTVPVSKPPKMPCLFPFSILPIISFCLDLPVLIACNQRNTTGTVCY